MLPFATLIQLDKSSPTPVFRQLSEQVNRLIQTGTLAPGSRLPGTRQLAQLLHLHRQTIVAAYDEGLAQGWLESRAGSGTFVAQHLPGAQPQPLVEPIGQTAREQREQPGYAFERRPHLTRPVLASPTGPRFDDGFPDARLAPLDELSRHFRETLRTYRARRDFLGDQLATKWVKIVQFDKPDTRGR